MEKILYYYPPKNNSKQTSKNASNYNLDDLQNFPTLNEESKPKESKPEESEPDNNDSIEGGGVKRIKLAQHYDFF